MGIIKKKVFPLQGLMALIKHGGTSVLYIVIFVFFGTYLREISLVYIARQQGINRFKIFIGTLIGVILTSGIKEYYLRDMEINSLQMLLPSFMCGMIGYEVFTRIGSIKDIKQLANDIHEIFSILMGKYEDEDDDEKHKDKHERR